MLFRIVDFPRMIKKMFNVQIIDKPESKSQSKVQAPNPKSEYEVQAAEACGALFVQQHLSVDLSVYRLMNL